jgi:hypothetical protein
VTVCISGTSRTQIIKSSCATPKARYHSMVRLCVPCVNVLWCYFPQPERPLEVIVQDRFAIIVRPNVLEIYGVPDQDFRDPPVIYPVAYHQWQWKLDSVCVSFQASWAAAQSKALAPIGILVRYGSLLPWVRRFNSHDA